MLGASPHIQLAEICNSPYYSTDDGLVVLTIFLPKSRGEQPIFITKTQAKYLIRYRNKENGGSSKDFEKHILVINLTQRVGWLLGHEGTSGLCLCLLSYFSVISCEMKYRMKLPSATVLPAGWGISSHWLGDNSALYTARGSYLIFSHCLGLYKLPKDISVTWDNSDAHGWLLLFFCNIIYSFSAI